MTKDELIAQQRKKLNLERRKRRRRKRMLRRLAIAAAGLLCLVLLGLAFLGVQKLRNRPVEEVEEEVKETTAPEMEKILPPMDVTITFCGDIMLPKKLHDDARDTDLTKNDQSVTYTYAGTSLADADYVVANLETTFAGKFADFPHYSADDGFAVSLKNLGFDLLTTGNNHCLDKGFKGLCRTLDVLDENGIAHTGTWRSQEEFDQTHGVYTASINGLSVTFVNYTYGCNRGWDDTPFALSCYNNSNMYQGKVNLNQGEIAERMAYARSLNSDLIVALLHWGVEYRTECNKGQQEVADFFLQQGADAIIGGHSHVPQNMEYRTVTDVDGNERTGFVCYSLGNHISDFKDNYTYLTAFLNLHVHKENGETRIDSIDYTPLHMLVVEGKEAKRYLVDSCAALADYENGNASGLLTEKSAEKVRKGMNDLQKIFGPDWKVRDAGRLNRQ